MTIAGSVRVARYAGRQLAAMATTPSRRQTLYATVDNNQTISYKFITFFRLCLCKAGIWYITIGR